VNHIERRKRRPCKADLHGCFCKRGSIGLCRFEYGSGHSNDEVEYFDNDGAEDVADSLDNIRNSVIKALICIEVDLEVARIKR
jgi:hypothetical protein